MESILPTNEYTEVDGRAYLNPQVGLDESNTFIDNLRSTQGQQNQEIFSDTQRLGTDISTNLGGLTGSNSYFTSRYQTPQTNAAVSSLRAAAQAQALNTVLANEQAKWQKRYQDAYRSYQKRQASPTTTLNPSTYSSAGKGEVEERSTDDTDVFTVEGSTTSRDGLRTIAGSDGITHIIDDATKEEITLMPGERIVRQNSLQYQPQNAPSFVQGVPVFNNGAFTTIDQFSLGGGR